MMRLLLSFLALMIMLTPVIGWAANDQGAPLSGKDLEMAQKMNDAYARSMFSSTCLDRQRALFMPKILTPQEKAQKLKEYSKSCDCLTDMVIKETSPNDVIGYVTKYNGKKTSAGKTANSANSPADRPIEFSVNGQKIKTVIRKTDPQTKKISDITKGKDTRKKCGFSQ